MSRSRLVRRLGRAWRALVGDWVESQLGTDVGRLWNDWVTSSTTADQEIMRSIRKSRDRARDLARKNPIAVHYLNVLDANVVGPDGFSCRPDIRDASGNPQPALNKALWDAWYEWAEGIVTVDGMMSFVELEHPCVKGRGRDGEALLRIVRGSTRNRFGLELQHIDPALLDETFNRTSTANANEIRMGVEVDADSRPVAYHILSNPTALSGLGGQRVRIPAEQIIHVFRAEFPGQTRGVTDFLPVMGTLKVHDAYREAVLFQARAAACQGGFFETKDEAVTADLFAQAVKNKKTEAPQIDLAPALALALPPGWTFNPNRPEQPSVAYDAFDKSIIRTVSTGLNVSYTSLGNDPGAANYSSMKNSLSLERDLWRVEQVLWAMRFRQRAFEAFVDSAFLSGALAIPAWALPSARRPIWRGRGWPSIEPLREAEANAIDLLNGLTSRTEILEERGKDFATVIEKLAEEAAIAASFGIELAKDPPVPRPQGQPSTPND